MSELISVRDLKRCLIPTFESMLSGEELQSLTFQLVKGKGRQVYRALPEDDLVEIDQISVRWQVCGEDGGSGRFVLGDNIDSFVHLVQGDLQDFIAESHFGWGERRLPRTRP